MALQIVTICIVYCIEMGYKVTLFSLTVDSVKSANADFMRAKQKSCKPYLVETFDVKMSCIDEGDRLDVCLLVKRNDHGETKFQVLMVKKNEIKDVTFDILNLHRYIFNSMSDV